MAILTYIRHKTPTSNTNKPIKNNKLHFFILFYSILFYFILFYLQQIIILVIGVHF